jgi:hypothetical protein
VDPVPDPLLLRKSSSAGNQTRVLTEIISLSPNIFLTTSFLNAETAYNAITVSEIPEVVYTV